MDIERYIHVIGSGPQPSVSNVGIAPVDEVCPVATCLGTVKWRYEVAEFQPCVDVASALSMCLAVDAGTLNKTPELRVVRREDGDAASLGRLFTDAFHRKNKMTKFYLSNIDRLPILVTRNDIPFKIVEF